MTKIVDITGSLVGDCVTCLNIYHSTVCCTNLLCSNASVAGVQSGVRVCSVPDSAFTFFFQDATYCSAISSFSLPKPSVTSFCPTWGTYGSTVGVTGSGLFGATEVAFMNIENSTCINACYDAPTNNTLLDACVQNCYSSDKTLKVIVSNPSGPTVSPQFFEYKTVKAISKYGQYNRYGSYGDAYYDTNSCEQCLNIYTLFATSLTELLTVCEYYPLEVWANSSLTNPMNTGYYIMISNGNINSCGLPDADKIFQITDGILTCQVTLNILDACT